MVTNSVYLTYGETETQREVGGLRHSVRDDKMGQQCVETDYLLRARALHPQHRPSDMDPRPSGLCNTGYAPNPSSACSNLKCPWSILPEVIVTAPTEL